MSKSESRSVDQDLDILGNDNKQRQHRRELAQKLEEEGSLPADEMEDWLDKLMEDAAITALFHSDLSKKEIVRTMQNRTEIMDMVLSGGFDKSMKYQTDMDEAKEEAEEEGQEFDKDQFREEWESENGDLDEKQSYLRDYHI